MVAAIKTTSSSQRPTLQKGGTPAKKTMEAPLQESREQREVKLAETDGWLTRDETSDLLHCTTQTLKNYEVRGLLHPRHGLRKDLRGFERVMLVYNPKELAALPIRNGVGVPSAAVREPGEQAARVFELLRQGHALDEIVIELRETPDRIDYLNERWIEQTRARYVITPEAKKALEQLVGPFDDVASLVALLKEKLKT